MDYASLIGDKTVVGSLAAPKRKRVLSPEGIEKNRARAKAWNIANPERYKARMRAHYLANKEARTAYSRERKRANPERERAYTARSRAKRSKAEGKYTAEDLLDIRKKQKGRCAYCRQPLGKRPHADHIIPLSKGGTNWPRNMQWLCAPCNCSKQALLPEDFARAKGMLC